MTTPQDPRPSEEHDDDEGNALGYRNADEEQAYDERGSQSDEPGDPPPGEENPSPS